MGQRASVTRAFQQRPLREYLSSAYEAMAMSRLRILDKQHKRILTQTASKNSTIILSAFLAHGGENGELMFSFERRG